MINKNATFMLFNFAIICHVLYAKLTSAIKSEMTSTTRKRLENKCRLDVNFMQNNAIKPTYTSTNNVFCSTYPCWTLCFVF